MVNHPAKPRMLIALLAIFFAVFVISPVADAMACAAESSSSVIGTEISDSDQQLKEPGRDTQHGACVHGHHHCGSAARIDGQALQLLPHWEPELPGFGKNAKWMPSASDGPDRPPRS
tara:strand:+ start:63 stop:413 length:351 start_codon:yes stop_codon:yes gene_type:complete